MKQFNLAINGQKAVDAAYAFIGNSCYRGIYNHGKRIGQVEVVIDDDGYYKGNPNKWVAVTVLEQKQIETVINQLSRIGFKGCPAMIEEQDVRGCMATAADLCCIII